MARIEFMAGEEFELKLSRLATDIDEVAKKAIYEGSNIIADEIKKNLENVLSDEATGDLVDSFGITPISKNGSVWSAKVGFDGYDNNGVAFQLIARALESGTSTRPAKPFARPTLNQTRKQVVAEMNRVINEEIQKIIK